MGAVRSAQVAFAPATSVAALPGLALSVLLHIALVGFYLLEPDAASRAAEFEDPLPQGLTFLVPPPSSPVQSEATPKFQEFVGDEGDAAGTREGEREDASATRTGERASRAAGSEESAVTPVEGVAGEQSTDLFADAFMDVEVDSAAERHPDSAAPVYPPELMKQGIEGHASVRFVVDTMGRVDPATVQIIEASRPEFGFAVLQAIPGMKFTPARMGPTKVRQLAEQLFRFAIARTDTLPPPIRPRIRPPSAGRGERREG